MAGSVQQTDVAIIGAGPVGLFAVFECGMLGLKCHVLDALGAPGGQCSALYPEKPIYDIPGHPTIAAADLIAKLEEQAAPFAPVYHLGQEVEALQRIPGGFRLATARGTAIETKAVIIAAGVGAFGPNRPPLDAIERYEGKSVFYLVSRREAFREVAADIDEGADAIIVKPALPYLDIVAGARERFDVPIAAYNVSGEYAMVKAAAMQGWIDERRVVLEALTSIKRAGADMIITYHAKDAVRWLETA